MRSTRFMLSTMCTGMRIVRAWSAIGTGDRLADPPRRVRRELEALGVVELVDRPHQAEVALLDEIEEQHAATAVALGDRHDEAQVGLDQLALRPLAGLDRPHQRRRLVGRHRPVADVEPLRRQVAVLDGLRQAALVVAAQQADPADLLQVHPHGVGRGRRLVLLGHPQRPSTPPRQRRPMPPCPRPQWSSPSEPARPRPASAPRPRQRLRRGRRSRCCAP